MKTKLLLIIVTTVFFGTVNLLAQDCTGFKTFTIGGWGTNCHGQNPGCYRDANFELAFPNGLTIGCGDNLLVFTSSSAIKDFLPSGSTPRALDEGTLTDPGKSYKNVLAAQLVGVTLAVGFDEYDEDFSSNWQYFANLIIASGTFEGMSVYDFLELANNVIGGCTTGYSFSDLNATATAINENYVGGNIDNDYLICPIIYEEKSSVNIYPNPMKNNSTLDFSFNYNTNISIELYNMNGQLINEIYNNNIKSDVKYSVNIDASTLKSGIYFVKLITDNYIYNKTVTITN